MARRLLAIDFDVQLRLAEDSKDSEISHAGNLERTLSISASVLPKMRTALRAAL